MKNTIHRAEWPTLVLIVACYLAWISTCLWHGVLGLWFVPIAGYLITLHSSLQHEALHGHPTRDARVNEALIFPAIGIFVPYRVFKRTHLKHHRDSRLTDPYDDPESAYVARRDWDTMSPGMQTALRVNQTLLGRLLIGPALSIRAGLARDIPLLLKGSGFMRRAYLAHAAGVLIALGFAVGVAGVPLWLYLAAAYAGYALLMLRTFAEHRASEAVGERTVVIEAEKVFALAFLNNNLHAVHHANPRAPWYDLPALYRQDRQAILAGNGGYRIEGYRALFARHALHAKERIVHPFLRRGHR
jgi:fatty acid desaturase